MKKLNSNSKLRNLEYNGVGSGGGVTPEVIEQLEQDVERSLLGNHVYSTTERVCGEWVDGSNIYEKVYHFDSSITVGTSFTDLFQNTDNIKTIIDGRGITVHGSVPMKFGKVVETNMILGLTFASSPIDYIVLQYIKNT